ncbi:hypothetical protein [uncultured Shewanella sp.]|uniref:hypothetical protein n=1 Tax=uncultured Shewanella sp. TaxID=173975 RepID=UPI002631F14D|nr:hypothetical protein [uncultured Shewanella sp.]
MIINNSKRILLFSVGFFMMNQSAIATNPQSVLKNKNILQIGASETFVGTALEQNNRVSKIDFLEQVPQNDIIYPEGEASGTKLNNEIKNKVADADIIYVDLTNNIEEKDELNAYIKEGIKQNKVIVLENMKKNQLTSFPMFFDAEITVIKARSNAPDKIVTFGTQEPVVEEGLQDASQNEQDDVVNFSQINSSYKNNPHAFPRRFDDMLDHQKEEVFQQVSKSINALLTPATASLIQTSSISSGGQVGYPCPEDAKAENLCVSYLITTNGVFYFDRDGAKINVIHQYSYAAYRTDNGTSIFISPWGSANPTLTSNSSTSRGYYIKQVRPEITVEQPTAAGMMLYRRTPENQNGSTSVSTTSGMSYDISASVSEKPSMGGKISYSSSQSESTNLSDWAATTRSDTGYDAKWDYHLNKYKSISDWISKKTFEKAKMKSIPSISANGVQYSAEAIWVGSPNTVSGNFNFNLRTYVVHERTYIKSTNIFGWKASNHWWEHTLYTGNQSFNTDSLKKL